MDFTISLFHSIISFSLYLFIFYHSFKIHPNNRFYHYLLTQECLSISFFNYITNRQHIISKNLLYMIESIISFTTQLIIIGKINNISYSNIYIVCAFQIWALLCEYLAKQWKESLYQSLFFISFGIYFYIPIYIYLLFDFNQQVLTRFTSESFSKKYYRIGFLLSFITCLYPFIHLFHSFIIQFDLNQTLFLLDFLTKESMIVWLFCCILNSTYINENQLSLHTNSL
jgi:hypothetical protein